VPRAGHDVCSCRSSASQTGNGQIRMSDQLDGLGATTATLVVMEFLHWAAVFGQRLPFRQHNLSSLRDQQTLRLEVIEWYPIRAGRPVSLSMLSTLDR
jgi:hypothetical protein